MNEKNATKQNHLQTLAAFLGLVLCQIPAAGAQDRVDLSAQPIDVTTLSHLKLATGHLPEYYAKNLRNNEAVGLPERLSVKSARLTIAQNSDPTYQLNLNFSDSAVNETLAGKAFQIPLAVVQGENVLDAAKLMRLYSTKGISKSLEEYGCALKVADQPRFKMTLDCVAGNRKCPPQNEISGMSLKLQELILTLINYIPPSDTTLYDCVEPVFSLLKSKFLGANALDNLNPLLDLLRTVDGQGAILYTGKISLAKERSFFFSMVREASLRILVVNHSSGQPQILLLGQTWYESTAIRGGQGARISSTTSSYQAPYYLDEEVIITNNRS